MSAEKTSIIPIVETDVFRDRNSTQFAIGIVAVDGVVKPEFEAAYNGALRLRANVYQQKGFLKPEDLDENGLYIDTYDQRAIQFAILEKTGAKGLGRVVAGDRLIVGSPLPIQGYCPDAFAEEPIQPFMTEVSGLTGQHENSTIQHGLVGSMFAENVMHGENSGLGPAFGLVEEKLTRSLMMRHVPIEPMADARYIPEINATKQPIRIDVHEFARIVRLLNGEYDALENGQFKQLNLGVEGTLPLMSARAARKGAKSA